MGKKKVSDPVVVKMREMRRQGLSYRAIGDFFGVTTGTARDIIIGKTRGVVFGVRPVNLPRAQHPSKGSAHSKLYQEMIEPLTRERDMLKRHNTKLRALLSEIAEVLEDAAARLRQVTGPNEDTALSKDTDAEGSEDA